MNGVASSKRSPLTFFILALGLASPFWVLGWVVKGPRGIPMDLPWSMFAVIAPVSAALILVYREEGLSGIRGLLKRPFEYQGIKPKVWYVPIIGFMPAVVALSGAVMSLLSLEAKGVLHVVSGDTSAVRCVLRGRCR